MTPQDYKSLQRRILIYNSNGTIECYLFFANCKDDDRGYPFPVPSYIYNVYPM